MENMIYKMLIDDENEDAPVFALSLVAQPAIEQNFVYLSKQEVKLAIQNEDKRMIVAPILVPEKLITRVDETTNDAYYITFPKETVQRAAELYLSKNQTNNVTLEHALKTSGVSLVQSWIVEDTEKDKSALYNLSLEPGTWAGVFRVENDEVWNDVKDGKFKGISIEGFFQHKLVKASATVIDENHGKETHETNDPIDADELVRRIVETIKNN